MPNQNINHVQSDAQTCNCVRRPRGCARMPIGYTYYAILQRCYNPKCASYSDYGARGITVCERWRGKHGLCHFRADMGDPLPPHNQIGRIDNDKGYSPENCRWETVKEQAQNRRSSRRVAFQGITQTVSEWTTTCGFEITLLSNRLRRGWSVERALTEPPNIKTRKR